MKANGWIEKYIKQNTSNSNEITFILLAGKLKHYEFVIGLGGWKGLMKECGLIKTRLFISILS